MSVPLRVIRLTTLDPRPPAPASDATLRRRHRQRQEEVVVAGDEPRRALAAEGREPRRQVADQQVAGGLASHVQFVSHLEALRGQREHVNRALAGEQLGHQRPELVAEEPQPLDRFLVANAEPQRPTRSLVERRVRTRSRSLVEHDPNRHRRRAHAGHRPDVPVLVAGRKRDVARVEQRPRLLNRRRPTLENAGGRERPALRVADPLHSIGVPEWSRTRSEARIGSISRAGATVTARGCAASIRRTTSSLALATTDPCTPHRRSKARTVALSPRAGGRHSTSITGAPWDAIASANVGSPTFTAAKRASTSRCTPPSDPR